MGINSDVATLYCMARQPRTKTQSLLSTVFALLARRDPKPATAREGMIAQNGRASDCNSEG